MAIRTIFSMAEDCARGERLGWQEFVRDFAGIAQALLTHYFPTLVPEMDQHVVAVFRRAGAHTPQRANTGPPPQPAPPRQNQAGRGPRSKPGFVGDPGRAGDPVGATWFAGLSFGNEREFMMAFRDLVLAYGREQKRLPTPEITLDQVRAVMKDLTLLEREMLWLMIKGYDPPRIAAIMMNAAATAEAVKRIADERLAPQRANTGPPPQRSKTGFVGDPGRAGDPALAALLLTAAPETLTVSARGLMESAEQLKTDQCPSLKTFNNLVNGQITWREREAAEQHMSDCSYCIDRFTSFQEMVRLRKDINELPAPQVGAILAQLPFAAGKPRGVLSRLLAGR